MPRGRWRKFLAGGAATLPASTAPSLRGLQPMQPSEGPRLLHPGASGLATAHTAGVLPAQRSAQGPFAAHQEAEISCLSLEILKPMHPLRYANYFDSWSPHFHVLATQIMVGGHKLELPAVLSKHLELHSQGGMRPSDFGVLLVARALCSSLQLLPWEGNPGC